jgi:hypothetical protein
MRSQEMADWGQRWHGICRRNLLSVANLVDVFWRRFKMEAIKRMEPLD